MVSLKYAFSSCNLFIDMIILEISRKRNYIYCYSYIYLKLYLLIHRLIFYNMIVGNSVVL